jgi:hypothetical protein
MLEFHGFVDDWRVLIRVVGLRSDDVADCISSELLLIVWLGRRLCNPCAIDDRNWLTVFSLTVGVGFFVFSVLRSVELLILFKFGSWGFIVVTTILEGVSE